MTNNVSPQSSQSGLDRVRRTLAAVLGVDPELLTDDASPLGIPSWDSLNHLNIVLAIESEFDVSLSIEDTLDMRNVATIRRILHARGVSV